MNGLEGEWGSRRKKRKVVDANLFGDVLPNGWKVLIAMKKKQGQAWLYCRRYVSPNGRHFDSCKEVSSYLLSLTGPQEIAQQSTIPCSQDTVVDNQLPSDNVEEAAPKVDNPSSSVAPQASFDENKHTQVCTSQASDENKQLVVLPSVQTGETQATSRLKCHKCSTPFSEKDELLNHLVLCHKRKRRKAGAPIDDDIVMIDGKYECQFCNKIFVERSSYFGHVGIHVKNYVKSISGSPGSAIKHKNCEAFSVGEAPLSASDTPNSMKVSATAFVDGNTNTSIGSVLNISSSGDNKKVVGSEARTLSDNSSNDQSKLSTLAESNMDAAGSFPNQEDNNVQINDNKVQNVNQPDVVSSMKPDIVMESDEPADTFSRKLDASSVSEKKLSGDDDSNICANGREINTVELIGSLISTSLEPSVRDGDSTMVSDSKQADLENDGNYDSVNITESNTVASENVVPSDNRVNFDVETLFSETLKHGSYDEGMIDDGEDELMVGSGNCYLDVDMDTVGDNQQTGVSELCSSVPHEEVKTSDIEAKKIGSVESTLADSKLESSCEPNSCIPCVDRETIGTEDYVDEDFTGIVDEADMEMCTLGKAEVSTDTDHCFAQEENSEISFHRISKDSDGHGVDDEAKVSTYALLDARAGGFGVEETCNLDDNTRGVSNRTVKELESDAVSNSCGMFFTPGATGTPLDDRLVTNNEQIKTSAASSDVPSGSMKSHGDVSNILSAYHNFDQDKEEQVSRSILSGFSMTEQINEIAMNNVTAVSAATTEQLPELQKSESSRSDKLILDFGGINNMSARFMPPVQQETNPVGSSPFSLWGGQACVQDNPTRVYAGVDGVGQQERASDSNSLNLFGFQQSCNDGFNVNNICPSEQRYAVQHDESGVYSRSNEASREGISRGGTLNLAGFQQQCGVEYNLNKPCVSQQRFSAQHNETRAYNTGEEVRQQRVAYGDSLSLASIQQTCDTGYSLDKGYTGSIQQMSKVDGLDRSHNRNLMVGYGNSTSRTNQAIPTDFLWRGTEGNMLPGGLVNSPSSQAQSTGSFQGFDFLSDKGRNGLYSGSGKFDNMSGFGGLRSTGAEPMEFSFLTTQNSTPQLQDPKVLPYNANMGQGFGSSVWQQKGTTLTNLMGGHVVSLLCVWCGNEFHQDSLSCEAQTGSIGYLCPTCKARMSGQFL